MKEIKKIIPSHIFDKIIEYEDNIEEIRLRKGKYLTIRVSGEMKIIYSVKILNSDIEYVINNATDFSVHAYIEQIKQGFLTFNSNRIGICGSVLIKNNEIINFSDISSLNIRIAKKFTEIDKSTLKSATNKNTLVIAPPNIGKTTLLREIIRFLSGESYNISVIDERFEIDDNANLGDFVDFIRGLNKMDSVFMMLKTMSPDYIVLDEISGENEVLHKIYSNGVNIIATIHGNATENIKNSEIFQYFDNFIEIYLTNNKRCYKVRGRDDFD